MAELIYGLEPFNGISIAEETSYGVTTSPTWLGIPHSGEDLHTEVEPFPESPEFSSVGAAPQTGSLGSFVRGSLRFLARLDGRWFGVLMGHVMGKETHDIDNRPDGSSSTGGNTHWYVPSNIARSLSIRVYKGGQSSTGKFSLFTGCIVEQMRVTQASLGFLLFEVSFIGKLESINTMSGAPEVPVGVVETSVRWLEQGAGLLIAGTELEVDSFTITFNRRLQRTPAFTNAITSPLRPAVTQNRLVQVDFTSRLLDTSYNSAKPIHALLNATVQAVEIDLKAAQIVETSFPYWLVFDFPAVEWQAAQGTLSEQGPLPHSGTFIAKNAATLTPSTGPCDMRIGHYVKQGDEPGGVDAFFTVDPTIPTPDYGVEHASL